MADITIIGTVIDTEIETSSISRRFMIPYARQVNFKIDLADINSIPYEVLTDLIGRHVTVTITLTYPDLDI